MDDDDIPDTRVFVKGLPPHYTTEQLGAHFAGRYQITDSVVIPNRRIGFVGFRNYTLAKNAVKYFDKSYIRMSKISVEIAQPVDFHRELNAEPEPEPQNVQRQRTDEKPLGTATRGSTISLFSPYESLTTKTSSKRKRADGEDQSKEMKEYMDAMQPKSNSTWANGESIPRTEAVRVNNRAGAADQSKGASEKREKKGKKEKSRNEDTEPESRATETSEAERKRRKKEKKEKKRTMEAIAQTPGAEAEMEDKDARKKRKAEKKAKKLRAESTAEGGVEPLNDDASGVDDAETDVAQPEIPRSDNDWQRGKTTRLLDLLDPEEQVENQETTVQNSVNDSAESSNEDEHIDDSKPDHGAGDPNNATAIDYPSVKTIAVPNGRLFVRNLPFSTIETDLESTFARYGALVEVSIPFFPQLALFRDDS